MEDLTGCLRLTHSVIFSSISMCHDTPGCKQDATFLHIYDIECLSNFQIQFIQILLLSYHFRVKSPASAHVKGNLSSKSKFHLFA